MSKIIQPMIWN